MIKLMTPGPTQVRENVRMARSIPATNPDLDLDFYDFYKETCEKISEILHTRNTTYILSGEGILGLEAGCASLTEPGDRVLILDNGIYGHGFADFVTMYGGVPVFYTSDYKNEINTKDLKKFLENDSDFKYATIVHCDTPTGVLNDVRKISRMLHKYGILSLVDSVSGMFGNALYVNESKIDILCGGSQKALSAPPGLTFVTLSSDAENAIKNRKIPVASFYANLNIFEGYYEKKWFPYTMPISDIYGLRAALDNILEEPDILNRHEKIAAATRSAIKKSGLTLYLESGFSNTVTIINVPENIDVLRILETMKTKYKIMLAGSFDTMSGKVFRIGHMGENANAADVAETLYALEATLRELGVSLKCNLKSAFLQKLLDSGYIKALDF